MSFQLSPRSLQRLEGVHPKLVNVVKAAIAISKVDFTVIEGVRSLEKQREYFLAGKSRTMKSKHLTGHAVDLAPIVDIDGDGRSELTWQEIHFLPFNDAMVQAATNLGITVDWGGRWASFKDCPHFEIDPQRYPYT
jgi:peptidoglycan L-alanyl-D-glutamate endopeptidase CwlK